MNLNLLTLITDILFILILSGGLFAGGFVFYWTIYRNKDIFDDGALRISTDVRDELRAVKDEIKKELQEIKQMFKDAR